VAPEERSNGRILSIFKDLAVEDMPKSFESIRMSYPKFLELVVPIGLSITKKNTHCVSQFHLVNA